MQIFKIYKALLYSNLPFNSRGSTHLLLNHNRNHISIIFVAMRILIEILFIGIAVCIAAFLVPGVQVNGFLSALTAGILIALANATVGTLLRILTFPINLLSLGLMSFIISVLMVLLVDHFMTGFNTSGFFSALIFALVLSVVKMIFGIFK